MGMPPSCKPCVSWGNCVHHIELSGDIVRVSDLHDVELSGDVVERDAVRDRFKVATLHELEENEHLVARLVHLRGGRGQRARYTSSWATMV